MCVCACTCVGARASRVDVRTSRAGLDSERLGASPSRGAGARDERTRGRERGPPGRIKSYPILARIAAVSNQELDGATACGACSVRQAPRSGLRRVLLLLCVLYCNIQ